MCFVLPALEVGRTVVVSPLLALMQDQVEKLRAAGVNATFINTDIDRNEQNRRYVAFIRGEVPLLYVAPERFGNESFTSGLARHGVNLLAIDEAHCISEWGHNFRPDYLQLGAIRKQLGGPRTLALTATATPQVRQDIAQRLGIGDDCLEVIDSVDRPNLTYSVETIEGEAERLERLLDFVRTRSGRGGIVYVRTQLGVDTVARALVGSGINAGAYHAGLSAQRRAIVQRSFLAGSTPIMVATIAFGMGVDKPDVRFVVHLNLPARLEAYHQESGRAGRDGGPAECVLLYARRDRKSQQYFIDRAHPSDRRLRAIWRRCTEIVERSTGRLPYDVTQQIPGLETAVVAFRESGLIDPNTLRLASFDPDVPIDSRSVRNHKMYAQSRLQGMIEYAESIDCRRAVLLRYFGEKPPKRCGTCDNCRLPAPSAGRPAYTTRVASKRGARGTMKPASARRPIPARKSSPVTPLREGDRLIQGDRVRHKDFGEGIIQSTEVRDGDHYVRVRFPGTATKLFRTDLAGLMRL